MPTYQYECKDCQHRFEQFQKFSDDPLTDCPTCEGSVRRVIQNVGVVFKGSGWYINDSRSSSKDKSSSEPLSTEKPAAESAPKSETSTKTETSTKSEPVAGPAPAAAP